METTDQPLIGKALVADLKRQIEDERQAHLVCIEMRNDAEAERDRLREHIASLPDVHASGCGVRIGTECDCGGASLLPRRDAKP